MQRGFTLIELMVVVAVIAILVAIAIPQYRQYTLKSNRPVGTACLVEAQRRVEDVFVHLNRYPTSLTGAGYSTASPTCGDQATYSIALSFPTCTNATTCYQIVATPHASQARDGSLRLTYNVGALNPNNSATPNNYIKEHLPFGKSTWVSGWDFQPGQ